MSEVISEVKGHIRGQRSYRRSQVIPQARGHIDDSIDVCLSVNARSFKIKVIIHSNYILEHGSDHIIYYLIDNRGGQTSAFDLIRFDLFQKHKTTRYSIASIQS